MTLLCMTEAMEPWMIIECKEMNASVNKNVLEQILRYHITFLQNFLLLLMGVIVLVLKKKNNIFLRLIGCRNLHKLKYE